MSRQVPRAPSIGVRLEPLGRADSFLLWRGNGLCLAGADTAFVHELGGVALRLGDTLDFDGGNCRSCDEGVTTFC